MILDRPHRCKFLTFEELKEYWPDWKTGDTKEMLLVPVTVVQNAVLDLTLFYDVGLTCVLYVAAKRVTDTKYTLKRIKGDPDRLDVTVDLEFTRVCLLGVVNKFNPEESKVRVLRLSPCE
jgi:hypothetical protein